MQEGGTLTVPLKESDQEPLRAQVTRAKEKCFGDWTKPVKEEWDKEFIGGRY